MILPLKTMTIRIFFFEPFPPMKREIASPVSVYGHYENFFQAPSRFMRGGGEAVKYDFKCILWRVNLT